MFTRMPGNSVVSDEGYQVTIHSSGSREGLFLHYIEDSKILDFDVFFEAHSDIEKTWREPSRLIVNIPLNLAWSVLVDGKISKSFASQLLVASENSRVVVNIEKALNFMELQYLLQFE